MTEVIIISLLTILGGCVSVLGFIAYSTHQNDLDDRETLMSDLEIAQDELRSSEFWVEYWRQQAERIHFEMVTGCEHDYQKCFCMPASQKLRGVMSDRSRHHPAHLDN